MSAKKKQPNISELVEGVLTSEEIDDLTTRLQQVSQALRVGEGAAADKLEGLATGEHRRLKWYLRERGVDNREVTDVGSVLQEWRAAVQDLPVLKLRLAFEPRQQFITEIKRLLKLHDLQAVQLEVTVDSRIVGGAVIGWQGKLYDHSLRDKLEARL